MLGDKEAIVAVFHMVADNDSDLQRVQRMQITVASCTICLQHLQQD